MSYFKCCFLTCINISQEAGKVVWYSHSLKNCPQVVVIHTVKSFGVVNESEVDVFLKLFCSFDDPVGVGDLISGSSPFSKSSLNIWKLMVRVLLKPDLENSEHCFASVCAECSCAAVGCVCKYRSLGVSAPSFCFGYHHFVFYICDSISVL